MDDDCRRTSARQREGRSYVPPVFSELLLAFLRITIDSRQVRHPSLGRIVLPIPTDAQKLPQL